MLRQRLNNGKDAYYPYHSTPISQYYNLKTGDKPILTEWKLSLIGLVLSLIVISGKLLYANHEAIRNFVVEYRLVSYEIITEDGDVMMKYAWKNFVRFSNIWLPALCGLLTTYFTWMMVYLDSDVPGIQPPSPLSPSKYRKQSGHSFHLNYIFAVLIGILVASYMYWRNISIQY